MGLFTASTGWKLELGRGEINSKRYRWISQLLTLVLILSFAAPALAHGDRGKKKYKQKKPIISFAVVNETKTEIDINGNFLHKKGKTKVILGRNKNPKSIGVDIKLDILSWDDEGKQIIVGIPIDPNTGKTLIVEDGTHLLTVKTKKGAAEFHATFGSVGKQGEKGAKGDKGAPGPQGIAGKDGPPGVNGANGLPGVPGLPGAPGQAGIPGKDGIDGKNGADGSGVVSFEYGNTAGGENALPSTTVIGSDNTAFGFETLTANTTGERNIGIGGNVLKNNTTGHSNTASGFSALKFNDIGSENTATGAITLALNTTGFANTATGAFALFSNTTGFFNTATGGSALTNNSTGSYNTATGLFALTRNTSGSRNIGVGPSALLGNSTGNDNIAIGFQAGGNIRTGSNNLSIANFGLLGDDKVIRIGQVQTRTFISGIRGTTTDAANAVPVVIDSNGQLGTVSSSERYKEDIRDLGELSNRLLSLRPVKFRYKADVQKGDRPVEYGLIAEEVDKVFPELVVYNEEGKPETVRYHILSTLLLNELQAVQLRVVVLEEERKEREALKARISVLEGMVQRLAVPRQQLTGLVPAE